jgi:predicted DNA binding protein
MRKMTLVVEPNDSMKEVQKPLFKMIHQYEILETLKIEWEIGICVDLIEVTLREGLSIQDLKFIGDMEILSILRSEGYKHTCLMKSYESEDTMDLFKEFNLDLIYSTPTIISEDRCTFSVIGDNKNLTKFAELIKIHAGTIENLTFQKARYQKQDILSVLTDKQREIIIAAHKYGYYDYPKKINSEKLSQKVNISKGTMVEHLRKAEGRILNEILAGYT